LTAATLSRTSTPAYEPREISHSYIKSLVPKDLRIARLLFQELADGLFNYCEVQQLLLKTILEQAIDLGRLEFDAFQKLLDHNSEIHLHQEAAERVRHHWGWVQEELEFFEEKIDDAIGQTLEELGPLVDFFYDPEVDFYTDLHDNWRNFGWDLKWTVETTCEGRVVGIWDEVTDSDPIEMYFEGRCYEWMPAYNEENYPDIANHN
jgi:hypothetical protein